VHFGWSPLHFEPSHVRVTLPLLTEKQVSHVNVATDPQLLPTDADPNVLCVIVHFPLATAGGAAQVFRVQLGDV
jgi:hypothetical protein